MTEMDILAQSVADAGIKQNDNQHEQMTIGDETTHTDENTLPTDAELEALAIQCGRMTTSGKIIKSAKPYGFFETPNEKPAGLRKHDLSVTFSNQQWNVGSNEIVKLISDLGYENITKAQNDIHAIGRFGNRVVLTTGSKPILRALYKRLSEQFSSRYRAHVVEDNDLAIHLSNVPHDMSDDDIKGFFAQFGELDGDIVKKKCDLGFYNQMRTVMMTNMNFDIKSFVKIKGYMIGVKYFGQPQTCRICDSRDHIANACPKNETPIVKSVQPQQQNVTGQHKVMCREEKAISALYDNCVLLQDKTGTGVNSPEFRQLLETQTQKLAKEAFERDGTILNLDAYRAKLKVVKSYPSYSLGSDYNIADRNNMKRGSYYSSSRMTDKRPRNEYDWRTASTGNRRNKGMVSGYGKSKTSNNYDFYEDADKVGTQGYSDKNNRYTVLRDNDLHLSEDDC